MLSHFQALRIALLLRWRPLKRCHAAIVTPRDLYDVSGRKALASLRLRVLSGITHRPIVANNRAECQARHIDMRFSQNVHHLLACGQKVVGDDPAVAAPPDRFGAHDHASLFRAAFPEPRQAGSEWRRQGVVRVVSKAAHAPQGIGRGPRASRPSPQAAKFGDVLVPDLQRGQGSRECFLIELRIGARPGHRPDVDNEADA